MLSRKEIEQQVTAAAAGITNASKAVGERAVNALNTVLTTQYLHNHNLQKGPDISAGNDYQSPKAGR